MSQPKLFRCTDCGNPVSYSASACPKCGRVYKQTQADKTAKGVQTVFTVLLAIIVVPFFVVMVLAAIIGLLSGP